MSTPAPEQTRGEDRQGSVPPPPEAGTMPEPPKLRRRPMLIALSVLLTAVGALLAAFLLTSLSGTESYIAINRDVPRGAVIERDDLVRTELRRDAAVAPLSWESVDRAIGQRATKDLSKGSLLTQPNVASRLEPVAGRSVVGLSLGPGAVPSVDLAVGDPVSIVFLDPEGAVSVENADAPVQATIAGVTTTADGGARLISVDVASGDRELVSRKAASQQVALVLNSREEGGEAAAEPSSPSSSPSSSSTSAG